MRAREGIPRRLRAQQDAPWLRCDASEYSSARTPIIQAHRASPRRVLLALGWRRILSRALSRRARGVAGAAPLALLLAAGCRSAGPEAPDPPRPAERTAAPAPGLRAGGPTLPRGPILRFREHDEDGGRTRLDDDVRFIDANSRIEVLLAKDVLRRRIAGRFEVEGVDPALLDEMLLVQESAVAGLRALEPLAEAARAFAEAPEDAARIQALQEALRPVATQAEPLVVGILDPDSRLHVLLPRTETLLAGDLTVLQQYRGIFELVEDHADQVVRELDAAFHAAAFAVLLEARIVQGGESRNVHCEGFDTYPEGELFRVERWRVAPTDEQRQKLERISELAASIESGATDADQLLRQAAGGIVGGSIELARGCLERLGADLAALRAAGEEVLGEEEAELARLETRLRSLLSAFAALRERLLGEGGGSPDAWASELRRLSGDVQGLAADVLAFLSPANLGAALDQLTDEAAALRATLEGCIAELRAQVERRLRDLTDLLGLTSQVDRVVEKLGAFGDKVLLHSLEGLPERTEVDLPFTGARAVGDGLVLRIGVVEVAPGTGRPAGDPTTLERRTFELAQVLWHVESAVNLGFADPNGSAAVSGTWQTVPAYSLLLKRDSRTSGFYNRILDPGVGLHLAALDFDGDDSPELGVGAVLSFFHDYLQAGYGFDIAEDRWYGFFGIGVPLSLLEQSFDGVR